MSGVNDRPLFIYEMANNHMGSVEHGIQIVRALQAVSRGFPFSFAVKLQYRNIETFVHPDYLTRTDLKFVKRFTETRLSWEEYKAIKDAIVDCGFLAICTPWDEVSVGRIVEHGYDFLKIPSCYFTDWPLLERIAQTELPLIASVAGVPLEDIDRVVSFFVHRDKKLSLMHCVGEYATPDDRLELNQIDLLKQRYPRIEVGYSTHERPDNVDAVKMAVAKGATIFEKHVGVPTDTIKLNAYSATPEQVRGWLSAAQEAFAACGVAGSRYVFSPGEVRTLGDLKRGMFAKVSIPAGERIRPDDVFYAIPSQPGQLSANEASKYSEFHSDVDLRPRDPVMLDRTRRTERRELVYRAVQGVKRMLQESKVVVPSQVELEISHHYGLENFAKFGSTVITVVNREYCKRLIVL